MYREPIPSKLLTLAVASMWLLASWSHIIAAGAEISGQITNGTTGSQVANQTLQLLMPRGGMQQVATAVTDASGHFAIASADIAADSFYLLQATYQDVNYHAPVKFDDRGQAHVDITVYEATHNAPTLGIKSARIVVRADGSKVHVQEMFAIQNSSSPPRSYVNPDGTFLIHLSKTAGEPTGSVAGLMNMTLPQPVNPGKEPGDYYIQYPLKPGLTVMMVTYDADYSSYKLDLADSVAYPIDNADLLVLPPNLAVDSALFKFAGSDADTGAQRYVASNLPAQARFGASVSGEAVAASVSPNQSGNPDADQGGAEVKSVPNSMERMGGLLLACFLLALVWGLGVRVAKEWPEWKARETAGQKQKALRAEVEKLLNSIADLDELFAGGKIAEQPYWKERLEMKARLVAALKKAPPKLLESYAIRQTPR